MFAVRWVGLTDEAVGGWVGGGGIRHMYTVGGTLCGAWNWMELYCTLYGAVGVQ